MVNSMNEVYAFVSDVLGEEPSLFFQERMDNFVYYVKMSALTNPNVTETWMKSKLKKYASNIIIASIKSYLDKNFSDEKGEILINTGFGKVYDKEMKPIEAVNRVNSEQRALMKTIVSMGMSEFAKGRDLAMAMIDRAMRDDVPPEAAEETEEGLLAEVARLEGKLPKITDEEADRLTWLYKRLKGA